MCVFCESLHNLLHCVIFKTLLLLSFCTHSNFNYCYSFPTCHSSYDNIVVKKTQILFFLGKMLVGLCPNFAQDITLYMYLELSF